MDARLAGELAVALGIGLLVGAERERRKVRGRGSAGIRTFGLASLGGAVATWLGGTLLLAAATLAVAGLAALSYARSPLEDRGLTTELALVVSVLLGGIAIRDPILAAGLGVVVATLLTVREELHGFVRDALSARELDDALLFGAATLIVLPLLPDQPIDPLGVLVPRTVWELAVLVMAVSAGGYIALRVVGPRLGLPLAGIAGGFVSGSATIGAMGARARRDGALESAAVSGATLSNISTVVELAAILFVVHPPTLRVAAGPLLAAGLAAAAYGAVFTVRNLRRDIPEEPARAGRAFDLRIALAFAVTVTLVLFAGTLAHRFLGGRGLAVAMGLTGFADTHAPAFSVASLARAGRIGAVTTVVPLLAAFSANTITKGVVAFMSGGPRFALRLVPGLAMMVAAAWAGTLLRF